MSLPCDRPAWLRRTRTHVRGVVCEERGILHVETDDPVASLAALGGGLHVTVSDTASGVANVRAALGGSTIRHLDPIEPNREDVFVSLTKEASK